MLTSELVQMYEEGFATVVVNLETGVIVWTNQLLEHMFGYHMRNCLRGESIELLLPLDQQAKHRANIASYAENPELRPMGAGKQVYGRHKDGSEFPVFVMLAACVLENKRLGVAIVGKMSTP